MGKRSIMKIGGRRCYVIRRKNGRIKAVQSISRALKVDRSKKARYHPKRPGYGYLGDYLR